jgi:hypothetical protein
MDRSRGNHGNQSKDLSCLGLKAILGLVPQYRTIEGINKINFYMPFKPIDS